MVRDFGFEESDPTMDVSCWFPSGGKNKTKGVVSSWFQFWWEHTKNKEGGVSF